MNQDSTLCDQVKTIVDTDFNKVLAAYKLTIPLDLPGDFNISTADFDFVAAPTVTSSSVLVHHSTWPTQPHVPFTSGARMPT